MKRLSAANYAQLYVASATAVPVAQQSDVAARFLNVLRRHRAMKLLPRILSHLQRLDDANHGRTRVAVTVPQAKDATTIEQRLTETLGPVAIDLTIDPALRGGIVLRVGDDEIDGSLRTRLRQLHDHLTHD